MAEKSREIMEKADIYSEILSKKKIIERLEKDNSLLSDEILARMMHNEFLTEENHALQQGLVAVVKKIAGQSSQSGKGYTSGSKS